MLFLTIEMSWVAEVNSKEDKNSLLLQPITYLLMLRLFTSPGDQGIYRNGFDIILMA